MKMWLGAAKEDDSKGAVAAAMEMAGGAVKVLGAAPVGAAHLEALCGVVQALLRGEAACQSLEEDEQAEEDEEEERERPRGGAPAGDLRGHAGPGGRSGPRRLRSDLRAAL